MEPQQGPVQAEDAAASEGALLAVPAVAVAAALTDKGESMSSLTVQPLAGEVGGVAAASLAKQPLASEGEEGARAKQQPPAWVVGAAERQSSVLGREEWGEQLDVSWEEAGSASRPEPWTCILDDCRLVNDSCRKRCRGCGLKFSCHYLRLAEVKS